MRRLVLALALLAAALAGCAALAKATPQAAQCSPPPGGRCAHDVAWSGPIYLTRDGLRLHQVIICSGTLHARETADHVFLRLHVGAMGPGSMSCPRVDVGVRLSSPLGTRTVVDAVSGHAVRVVHGRPPVHLVP